MANIRDVAQLAGVSLGTVSNAINRPELLASSTLQRIQKVIEELEFVPNASARNLRSRRNRVIGLVLPDVSNPFYTDLAKGVNDAAYASEYVVILCNTDGSAQKEVQYLDVLARQNVEGILITPVSESNLTLANVAERGIRLALVDRFPLGLQACSVAVNDVYGGSLALTHLHDLGHRKILVIMGKADFPQVVDRITGIKQAIESIVDADAPEFIKIHLDSMSVKNAYEVIRDMNSPFDFTGVICGNDLIAIGVIRALGEKNISIPDDVSVIGYDDIDFATSATVPITSISQPSYELGFTAAELLISEGKSPEKHVHQRIEFQPKLVVRSSTAGAKSHRP